MQWIHQHWTWLAGGGLVATAGAFCFLVVYGMIETGKAEMRQHLEDGPVAGPGESDGSR